MDPVKRNPSPLAASLTEQGLPPNYNFRPDWEVTPRQVKTMLDAKSDFVFIDCRTPGEFTHCKIAGTQLLPVQEAPARLGEIEELKDKKIIVTCHHGARSLRMAMLLRQTGFTDVFSMAGGIDLWSIDIDQAIPRY